MESNFCMNVDEAIEIAIRVSKNVNLEAIRKREKFLRDMEELVHAEEISGGVRLSFDEEKVRALDRYYEAEEKLDDLYHEVMKYLGGSISCEESAESIQMRAIKNLNMISEEAWSVRSEKVAFQKNEPQLNQNNPAVWGNTYGNVA